jgi:tetratricopeptide (TPR) repeat protein
MDAKDYAGAKEAFLNNVHEAEAALTLAPDDQTANRNLSSAFKQLGTSVHMVLRFDEAIGYYERALALDRDRVERSHGSAEARLDLSFSHGALGGALIDKKDLDGAREHYRQAIELRRSVIVEDPKNDRAMLNLAFGYQQLAKVETLAGNVQRAAELREARLTVLRDRAAAHPERQALQQEYANALREVQPSDKPISRRR